MRSESSWTREVCRELTECGALVLAIVGSRMQQAGWPDRYIHHPKWRGWIEFKGAQGKLSAIQKETLSQLNRRARGSAYVAQLLSAGRGENVAVLKYGDNDIGVYFDGTGRGLLDATVTLSSMVMVGGQ